jgi:predicted TPR repeat methyltransferase
VSTRPPRKLSEEKLSEVEKWLSFLRAAVLALPEGSEAAKRGRTLNSVGTASLLLGPAGANEACSVLREAVHLVPSSWHVWSNLVKVLRRKAKDDEPKEKAAAEREMVVALQTMAELRPKHPCIFYKLGMALKNSDKTDEAIVALERHLQEAEAFARANTPHGVAAEKQLAGWKTAPAKHWLAVMKGDNTATAPPEYVAGLFDGYADHFEEHLVQKLQYNTPTLIAEDLSKANFSVASWRRAADLGCGTGLMCPALRRLGFQGWLEGVDLSEGMLVQAVKKGGLSTGYARLLCGDNLDIFEPLRSVSDAEVVQVERFSVEDSASCDGPADEESRFDLVVAADVFVYIGNLEPTFKKVAQWLTPGGVFAFSTESMENPNGLSYKLTETGRFTHAPSYISELSGTHGFEICSTRTVVLRMNAGRPVNGHVHVLRQASTSLN